MKKKLGFLVFFLMLLTSCNSNKKEDPKNDIPKEMFVKAYDEYCIDFDDLTYDDFYTKSNAYPITIDELYYTIGINDSIKDFSILFDNEGAYKSITKYNETGKTILKNTKEFENGIWYDNEYITFNYNESGNLVSENEKAYFLKTNKIQRETAYGYVNDTLKNETTIIYDENGNQTKKTYVEYDTNGSETLRIEYKNENGEFVKYYECQSEYDSNNNIKNKSVFKLIEEKWIQTYKYNNYLVIFSIETSVDGLKLKYKIEYEYDDNGHLLKEVESDFSEDNWIFVKKSEYDGRYDDKGTFIGTRIDYKYVDNNWVYSQKYVWELIASGQWVWSKEKGWELIDKNVILSSYYKWENDEWVLIA